MPRRGIPRGADASTADRICTRNRHGVRSTAATFGRSPSRRGGQRRRDDVLRQRQRQAPVRRPTRQELDEFVRESGRTAGRRSGTRRGITSACSREAKRCRWRGPTRGTTSLTARGTGTASTCVAWLGGRRNQAADARSGGEKWTHRRLALECQMICCAVGVVDQRRAKRGGSVG